jgi:hypothetical protein
LFMIIILGFRLDDTGSESVNSDPFHKSLSLPRIAIQIPCTPFGRHEVLDPFAIPRFQDFGDFSKPPVLFIPSRLGKDDNISMLEYRATSS